MTPNCGKKVVYIYSDELLNQCNKNPAVIDRGSMVHELIKCYELLNFMEIRASKISQYTDLRAFHSEDYLCFLKNASEDDEEDLQDCSLAQHFGLGYDCPVWSGIYNYCLMIAGSTIKAAEEILNGADILLNWFGGWHHADSNKAAGYCYVNDIVLGILSLRKKFDRVLYIDLDVHHGDGVEGAFETTKRVFTLSFHQYEPGFYPGTGNAGDCGFGSAKGYSANFPYKSGISGELYKKYFKRIAAQIFQKYQPQVCVVQCGGDVIVGDPLSGTNITPEDMGYCIKDVLSWNVPTMMLGGGGYNFPNTSRYWTFLTSIVCTRELNADIPDDNEHFLSYGPDYVIQVSKKKLIDMNDDEYLERISVKIEDNFEKYNLTAI